MKARIISTLKHVIKVLIALGSIFLASSIFKYNIRSEQTTGIRGDTVYRHWISVPSPLAPVNPTAILNLVASCEENNINSVWKTR